MAVVVKTHGIPFWARCTTHFRTFFSGDWDVHWGTGFSGLWMSTHPKMEPEVMLCPMAT